MFAAAKMGQAHIITKNVQFCHKFNSFLDSYNILAKNNDENLVNQYILLEIHVYITSQKWGRTRFLIHLAKAYKTNLLRVKDN